MLDATFLSLFQRMKRFQVDVSGTVKCGLSWKVTQITF